MGMYTELVVAFEMYGDTPTDVIKILQYMMGDIPESEIRDIELPDHPLFQTARWRFMLRCDSAYFSGKTHSELSYEFGSWIVNIRCNFKNYDDEIDKFIDWITPYIDRIDPETDDGKMFIGYHRYEECSEPTLIYI